MTTDSNTAVFVYGTLTDRKQVESVLGDSEVQSAPSREGGHRPQIEAEIAWSFAGPATLEGLHRVEGQYPTLAPGGSVDGRLLAVDEAGLDRLDRYEGVDRGLYVRVAVPRADGSGTVWTYVGDPDRLGVDVEWPEGPSFRERVRTVISRATVVVEHAE